MSRGAKVGMVVGLVALIGLGWALWTTVTADRRADAEGSAPKTSGASLALPPVDALDPATHAAVRGTVVDPLGQPAEGALVWAADGAGHLRQARTPSDGSFALENLDPGEYRIAAQRGAETSESAGPLPLGRGDDLRGLVLKLTPGARVAGAVFDARSRAPLPEAVVSVVGTPLSAIADVRGHFALPPLPPGGHQLSVQAEGHLGRVLPLTARSGDDTRTLEIYLTAAAHLSGQVVTKDGAGVPGAQLLLARYHASGDGPPLAPLNVSTDNTGHFALDLAPGLLQIVARSPGFAEAESEMLDLAEGKPLELRLTLGPGGEVDGTVSTADGQPVSGGDISVFRSAHGWQVGEAKVVASGRFTVSGLPAGRLLVSADATQARATAEVELAEGGQATVALRLGDQSLDGLVVGGKEEPVAGALVVARPVSAGEAGERSALSAQDGTFRINGLSGDHFDLAATKDDGSAELRGVNAGQHGVRLSIAAGGVSGTVLGPGGAAVSDFFVSAEPELPGHGRPRSAQAVDGRGEFHLSLAPGRYRLRARAPGYAEGEAENIEVAAGAETRGVRLELRPAGTIEGVVLEEKTSAPLSGIHLATDRGHAWGVGRESPLGGSAALSGPDGRFVLRDVAPGSWPVFANGPHLEATNGPPLVDIAPGKNPAPLEIRMRHSDGEGQQLYAGIGMSLYPDGDKKFAGEVFEGGPAHEAGIRSGDQILTIDGTSTESLGIGELAQRIRGPEGSEVTLSMRRGAEGEGYSVVVPRAEIRF